MSSSKQSMMPKRRKVLIYILVFITGGAVLTTLAIKLPIEGYDLLRITGSRAEIYPLYCKSIDYEPDESQSVLDVNESPAVRPLEVPKTRKMGFPVAIRDLPLQNEDDNEYNDCQTSNGLFYSDYGLMPAGINFVFWGSLSLLVCTLIIRRAEK